MKSLAGYNEFSNMLSSEQNPEEWLSSFLPLEEMIANNPALRDAKDDDSSTVARLVIIGNELFIALKTLI